MTRSRILRAIKMCIVATTVFFWIGSAQADVEGSLTRIETTVEVIGGGGATPVYDSDIGIATSYDGTASASAAADTLMVIAEDGTGADRGTGRGSGQWKYERERAGIFRQWIVMGQLRGSARPR